VALFIIKILKVKGNCLCLVLVLPNIKGKKKDKEFLIQKVYKFSSQYCWNKFLVRSLLPARPPKWFFKSCLQIS